MLEDSDRVSSFGVNDPTVFRIAANTVATIAHVLWSVDLDV